MLIKGLKGLFGFLTILPIGMESMEALSKYFFLCPIVGLVIGLIAGVCGFLLNFILPELICGFLVLAVVQFLTGFHHLDGLLDFSDAAMARGDVKRRLEVMHDMYTGAAAVVASVIVLATTGLAFGSFSGLNVLKVAVVSEVIAKESMLLMAYCGKKPSYEGSGFYVVDATQNKHAKILASLVLSSAIGFILIGFVFVFVFIGLIIAVYFLTNYSNRTLECVTGDVMGATNEINRLIALIIMLVFI